MLRLIGLLIKLALFSITVLILGNWLRWEGKTISDQVKIGMAHAEKEDVIGTFRGWAEQITHDAKQGFHKKQSQQPLAAQPTEEISSSERQKLKALIRELNSSRKKD